MWIKSSSPCLLSVLKSWNSLEVELATNILLTWRKLSLQSFFLEMYPSNEKVWILVSTILITMANWIFSSSLNQKEETICIFAAFYNLIEIVRLTSKLANIAQMEKNWMLGVLQQSQETNATDKLPTNMLYLLLSLFLQFPYNYYLFHLAGKKWLR